MDLYNRKVPFILVPYAGYKYWISLWIYARSTCIVLACTRFFYRPITEQMASSMASKYIKWYEMTLHLLLS